MLTYVALLFLLVLGTGLVHMWNDIKMNPVPIWHRWVHGLSAGLFLYLLVSEAVHSGIAIRIVTGTFIVVFLMGFFLLWSYVQRKPLPFMLALVHGLFGIVAYILLLASLGT